MCRRASGKEVHRSLTRIDQFLFDQESALRSLQSRDLRLFTDLVNIPEDDTFPLPAEHWINRELEDRQGRTLLLEAISLHLHDYVDTLLRAGARGRTPKRDFLSLRSPSTLCVYPYLMTHR